MVQVPTRRFGRTELELPVISCGGTRYSYTLKEESGDLRLKNDVTAADIPEEIHRAVSAIVNRSLELGINHFETAHGYGSSEVQLGQALSSIPRDKYVLQTKVGPTADESEF
ncbi:MAG: aldo/keto reductase, partial [Candidatus Poribacteria bacterium]|nr:aldo/keto reductase [Candidatus Poribacteria bacterium]